jgi:O-antigen ligase
MGLVACLAGSAIVVLLTAHALRSFGAPLFALPAALVLFIGLFLLYGQGLFERLETVDTATEIRGDLYSQVIELIGMRPWTGYGGGTFPLAFPIVHQPPVSPDYVWERAHSTYLSLWAETGVIFGSLPMIAIALVAVRLITNLAQGKGSWTAQAIALGAITVAAVHSTVDFSLEVSAVTFLFLALTAAGVSARARTREQ